MPWTNKAKFGVQVIEKRVHHEKFQVFKQVREEVEIHEPSFRAGIVVDHETQNWDDP
jgi:hypothetical protein